MKTGLISNVSDLFLGGIWFKSRMGHRLS